MCRYQAHTSSAGEPGLWGGEGGGYQVGRLVEVRNRNLPPSRHLARCGGQSHGCLGSRGRGGSSVLRAFRFRQWLIPGLPAVSARLTGSAHGDSMARGSRFLVLPHITELCYGPSDILHETIAILREPQSQPPCGGETERKTETGRHPNNQQYWSRIEMNCTPPQDGFFVFNSRLTHRHGSMDSLPRTSAAVAGHHNQKPTRGNTEDMDVGSHRRVNIPRQLRP